MIRICTAGKLRKRAAMLEAKSERQSTRSKNKEQVQRTSESQVNESSENENRWEQGKAVGSTKQKLNTEILLV